MIVLAVVTLLLLLGLAVGKPAIAVAAGIGLLLGGLLLIIRVIAERSKRP